MDNPREFDQVKVAKRAVYQWHVLQHDGRWLIYLPGADPSDPETGCVRIKGLSLYLLEGLYEQLRIVLGYVDEANFIEALRQGEGLVKDTDDLDKLMRINNENTYAELKKVSEVITDKSLRVHFGFSYLWQVCFDNDDWSIFLPGPNFLFRPERYCVRIDLLPRHGLQALLDALGAALQKSTSPL